MKNVKRSKRGIVPQPRSEYKHKPDENRLYDTIVIGAGVAGLAATMYGARLGLRVLNIGEVPGGMLSLVGKVENYPGFISIDGQKLAGLLEGHAMDYDPDMLTDIVEDVKYDRKTGTFSVRTEGRTFRSKTVILATGAELRKLGVPCEDKFFGNGVSYCALCDATEMKGKVAAVAGGGDSAVKEAIILSEYARKVYIINNEKDIHPEFSNLEILMRKVKSGGIEVINGTEIMEIRGDKRVRSIVLSKAHDGRDEIAVHGLFIYIGRVPRSSLADKLGVKLNSLGEVITNINSETSMPGFFAAGDVTDREWKQAITAVSQGVTSAFHAFKFVKEMGNI